MTNNFAPVPDRFSHLGNASVTELRPGQDRITAALSILGDAVLDGTLSDYHVGLLSSMLDQVAERKDASRIVSSSDRILEEINILANQAIYPDSRGFEDHNAIEFSVAVTHRLTARKLLLELLGSNGVITMGHCFGSVDFDKPAPICSRFVLFLESDNKARNLQYAARNATTSQQDDFTAAGLKFADNLQSLIVCAAIIKKAKVVGLDLSKDPSCWERECPKALKELNALEINLLTKLKTGLLRTSSFGLAINQRGCLRVRNLPNESRSNYWALGGRISKR